LDSSVPEPRKSRQKPKLTREPDTSPQKPQTDSPKSTKQASKKSGSRELKVLHEHINDMYYKDDILHLQKRRTTRKKYRYSSDSSEASSHETPVKKLKIDQGEGSRIRKVSPAASTETQSKKLKPGLGPMSVSFG
jgi:hypothetical protein